MSTDITAGSIDTVLSSANSIGGSVKMTATQALFLYRNVADTLLRARVLDISGTTVTQAGAVLALTASAASGADGGATSYRAGIVPLTSTKAVALFAYDLNNQTRAVTLDISAGAASSVTPGTITSVVAQTSSSISGARLTDSTMLVCWIGGGAVRTMVLTGITGTAITTNTIYDAATGMSKARVFPISSTQVLLVYKDTGTAKAEILDIAGTVVTVSNTVATIDTDLDNTMDVAVISSTQAIIAYRKLSTLSLATCLLTFSGSTITPGTPLSHPTVDMDAYDFSITHIAGGNVMVAYNDYNATLDMKAVIISGTNTVLGNILTVDAVGNAYSVVSAISTTQAILTYHTTANDYKAVILTTDPPDPPASPIVPTPLPMLRAALYGNYVLQATLPMLTARMVGGPKPSAIDVTLPGLTAAMRAGGRIAQPLPMLTANMAGTTSLFLTIDVPLPMLTARLEGRIDGSGKIETTLPGLTSSMRGGGTVRASLPMITVRASGTMGSVGRIVATLPMITVDMSATALAHAALEVVLPMLVPSQSGRIVSVLPMMQTALSGRMVVAVTYEAYAVNLKHTPQPGVEPINEVTRYTNYPFNQIVRYQDKYYGVADTGLYELTGTTDYATTPTAIPWAFKTAMTDDKVDEKKTVRALRFSGRVGPAATVTLFSGESGNEAHAYTTPRDATPQNHREKLGRGIKGRYYAVAVAGDGVLNLDGLEPEVDQLTRKL